MPLFITLFVVFIALGLAIATLIDRRENFIKYGKFDKVAGFRKPTKYLKGQEISRAVFQIIIVILGIAEILIGILVLDYMTFGSF